MIRKIVRAVHALRKIVPALLDVAGVAFIVTAAFLVAVPLGWFVSGLGCLGLSLLSDRKAAP